VPDPLTHHSNSRLAIATVLARSRDANQKTPNSWNHCREKVIIKNKKRKTKNDIHKCTSSKPKKYIQENYKEKQTETVYVCVCRRSRTQFGLVSLSS
jgi:hypothetical protein